VRLARGLLSDSETKVIFRQAPAELALVRDLCRLSEREAAIVANLPTGSALWKVGNRAFQEEHVLSAFEREVTWTDERDGGGAREGGQGGPLQKPRLIRVQTRQELFSPRVRDARIHSWDRWLAGTVGLPFERRIRRDALQVGSSLWSLSSWSPGLWLRSGTGLSTTPLSTLMATVWRVRCIQRRVVRFQGEGRMA
jgi:hypothetical protein